jgi:chlorobactene glucosyltransferase
MPLHRVNDPNRKESMGIGNFFMFERKVLEDIGGFESVKSEVAEDLKLAEIIKKQGFKLRIENASELIRTRMYEGFKDIWNGFTKNLFSGMKFSIIRTFFGIGSILLFGVLPVFGALIALVFGQINFFIPLFIVYLLQVFTIYLIHREWKSNAVYALLAPFGLLLFTAILANSTVKVLSGKGVNWKGRTIYGQSGIRPPTI